MKGGSYIHGISPEQVEALRELAEILGYKVSRGPGTGQGSLASLLRDVADRYRADPHDVAFQIAKVVRRAYAMPAKYRLVIPEKPDTSQL